MKELTLQEYVITNKLNLSYRARNYFEASSKEDIIKAIGYANDNNMEIRVIGNASNLLIQSIPKDVIVLRLSMNRIAYTNSNNLYVEAGVLLPSLNQFAYAHELSGLEWVSGIPGTLGGALYMNAGAFEKEIYDLVRDVTIIDKRGEEQTISKSELQTAHRYCSLQDLDCVIVGATLDLEFSDKQTIRTKMQALKDRRIATQPLGFTLGSTFKRVNVDNSLISAGLLIDKCCLKGAKVGHALVSDIHANFIINDGNATTEDVIALIDLIKKKVFDECGHELSLEIDIWR